MANRYVKSGAAGAADGSTWADAYVTIAAGLAASAAGDVLWVSHQHNETQASAMTWTLAGTAASPVQILCVNDGASPPTALATTAVVGTTGASAITVNGIGYIYGVSLNLGVGSSSSQTMQLGGGGVPSWLKLEKCVFNLATTGSSASVTIGQAASSVDDALVEFVDSQVKFASVGHSMSLRNKFRWSSTSGISALATGSVLPTVLITTNNDAVGSSLITGIDFSALTSGKSLVNAASTSSHDYLFRDCKLSTTANRTTGSSSGIGGSRIKFVNCNSGNVNYDLEDKSYAGTISTETVIVKTGGATDGTTLISRKMVSTANAKFIAPLESDPIEWWNETTGSGVTVTIPIVNDGLTLTDAEAWLEVECLPTSGFPLGITVSDRAADVITAGVAQTTDAGSTWTTTGLAAPVKQSLSVTVTPQIKGLMRARVCLARASTTIYFDPKAITGSRQYQAGSAYVNEPTTGGGGGGGGSVFSDNGGVIQ